MSAQESYRQPYENIALVLPNIQMMSRQFSQIPDTLNENTEKFKFNC